jgi:hypothetical protein
VTRTRLSDIHLKLDRAMAHTHDLERQIDAYARARPYTVRVRKDIERGSPVGRLIAVKNSAIGPPDTTLAVLAGEALYQLRSALDHAVHHLIIRNRQAATITKRTQFPICETAKNYQNSLGCIKGVSKATAKTIESQQPYKRFPDSPENDPLLILQALNNADKHRFLSATALGLGGVEISDSKGRLGHLDSPDITLKHNKVFWSFTLPDDRYDEIHADLRVAVAFADAMQISGMTVSIDGMLWRLTARVLEVLEQLGISRPPHSAK